MLTPAADDNAANERITFDPSKRAGRPTRNSQANWLAVRMAEVAADTHCQCRVHARGVLPARQCKQAEATHHQTQRRNRRVDTFHDCGRRHDREGSSLQDARECQGSGERDCASSLA